MNDFISIIRTDRFREIKEHRIKGYGFIKEDSYRLVDKIQIQQRNKRIDFGVDVTRGEIFFYIIDDGANAYLTIHDLYKLLLMIKKEEGLDFIRKILKRQMSIKIKTKIDSNNENKEIFLNRQVFFYRDIPYYIKKTIQVRSDEFVQPHDSAMKISYNKLFMLINLIQEKSSAFFLRGTENRQYADGLIRFLIVLLTLQHDIEILKKIGWKYDAEEQSFSYEKPKAIEGRSKRKYYLTEEEYLDIMKKES